MPQPNDDGLVPPLKTLRKRLNGAYRADGFSGPTRRYVLIVAMLVGLASLPTLAAITAGSNELDEGPTGALDVPFLPPASSGPVLPGTPPTSAPAADGAGVQGQAQNQKSKPDIPGYARSAPPSKDDPSPSRRRPTPVAPEEESGSADGDEAGRAPGRPSRPSRPGNPIEPTNPDRPIRHSQPSHHHRPDRSPHRQCENASHRAHKHATHQHRKPHRGRTVQQFVRSVVRHRSDDRSETTRRATVAEHPQNVRPARTADRTHNSRRLQAESRPDDAQSANQSYHGHHRAQRHHRAEDARANRRNSGADRHQTEHTSHR